MKPQRFFYVLCGLIAATVLVCGGAYYVASKWLDEGISTLSMRLGDQEVADQQQSDFQDITKQYTKLIPLLPVIDAALPKEKNASTIALQLRNIAATSGMTLNNLNFTAAPTPGPTSQTVPDGSALAFPITFELSGSYAQLQTFLQKQEHLNRYTSVTSLDITRDGSTGLLFNITLNAFVKP